MEATYQLTEDEAIALYKSEIWKDWTKEDIAGIQLYQDRLCVPFDVFHEAVEKVLDRPVYTHEFGSNGLLREEWEGTVPMATFDDVLAKLPKISRS